MANTYLENYRQGGNSPQGGGDNSYLSNYRSSDQFAEIERKRKKDEAARLAAEEAQRKKDANKSAGAVQRADNGFDLFDPNTGEKTTLDEYTKVKNIDRNRFVQSLADRGDPTSIESIRVAKEQADALSKANKPTQPTVPNELQFNANNPIRQNQEAQVKKQQAEANKKAVDLSTQQEADNKSRIATVSFLDKQVADSNGQPMSGSNLPTTYRGQETTFNNLLQDFNNKSRLDQDNQLKDLEQTIKNNRQDFGDTETAKIRDDAMLQKLVLEQRGELKNTDVLTSVASFGIDTGKQFIENLTGRGQLVNETISQGLKLIGGGGLGSTESVQLALDKSLAKGDITKRQWAEQMNRISNANQNIAGDGIDRGALDRLARIVGNVASVEGMVVPLRGFVAGAGKALAGAGAKGIAKEALLNGADNAVVSALATYRENGINTKLEDTTLAFIAGGVLGSGLSLAGSGIAAGIRAIANKAKSGGKLTPKETTDLNEFVGNQEGAGIVDEFNAPKDTTPVNEAVVPEPNQKPATTDGDAIVDEIQGAQDTNPLPTTPKTDYQGTNGVSGKATQTGKTLDTMHTQVDKLAPNNLANKSAVSVINRVKTNPNADVKVYRATQGDSINNGDWVFLTKAEADRFTKTSMGTPKIGVKVVEQSAKASDIQWSGKNLEFSYSPKTEVPKGSVKPLGKPKVRVESTVGTSKLAERVRKDAIKKKMIYGFDKTFDDLPTFDKANMKEQLAKATDLVLNDRERAIRIAMGQEAAPNGLLNNRVFIAVKQYAENTKDVDLMRQLSRSELTSRATGMGQEIAALAEKNPLSTTDNIRAIREVRQKRAEQKNKTTVAKETAKIKAEVKKSTPKVVKETWDSFVESIQC